MRARADLGPSHEAAVAAGSVDAPGGSAPATPATSSAAVATATHPRRQRRRRENSPTARRAGCRRGRTRREPRLWRRRRRQRRCRSRRQVRRSALGTSGRATSSLRRAEAPPRAPSGADQPARPPRRGGRRPGYSAALPAWARRREARGRSCWRTASQRCRHAGPNGWACLTAQPSRRPGAQNQRSKTPRSWPPTLKARPSPPRPPRERAACQGPSSMSAGPRHPQQPPRRQPLQRQRPRTGHEPGRSTPRRSAAGSRARARSRGTRRGRSKPPKAAPTPEPAPRCHSPAAYQGSPSRRLHTHLLPGGRPSPAPRTDAVRAHSEADGRLDGRLGGAGLESGAAERGSS